MKTTYAVFVLLLVILSVVESAYRGNCNNPHGNDCTWYRECLAVQRPCQGQTGEYAISYGENYCNRYSQASSSFSNEGKRWINAVRRCLQVKLAEKLSQRPSCVDLKTYAFGTHVPCYLNPGYGAPGFCSLPFADYGRMAYTICPSLASDLRETVVAGLRTLSGCWPW